MTEPDQELSPINDVLTNIDTDWSDDREGQAELTTALMGLFTGAMARLDVDNLDEVAANAAMQDQILTMMDRCFKAGMFYQHLTHPAGDNAVPITLTPQQVTGVMAALLTGEGVTLRLAVERG
jgi:hypothetical protein